MSTDSLINSVNKNYLEKVIDLAEEAEVRATEDIFDSRGMKLIAQGTKISRALQEKLIVHRLSKPLESSIAVEDGIDIQAVVAEAKRISETVEPVMCMLKAAASGGSSPTQILAEAKIGSAMSMMLTITDRGGQTALAHSVIVSMVSVCLAKKIGMSESDQKIVALSGLLHDIGELYIAPEYLNNSRRLLPHEWRHVVVHPRIGQMLIAELETYPPAVARAVSEHHERFDGAGYPRHMEGSTISTVGQVLAVAEMVSGVFMKRDRPLERAELALKIIPGEHASGLISAVSSTLRNNGPVLHSAADLSPDEAHATVRTLFARISSALDTLHSLLDSQAIRSKLAKMILQRAMVHVQTIQRAMSSTGLYAWLEEDMGLMTTHCLELMFEAAVATREIQWRLRDVARNLALQSAGLHADESELFQPLICLLDEQS